MMSLMPNNNKSIGKLRHQEYYNKEEEFQQLYNKSKNNEIFTNLIEKIFDEENILLAYRNIKKNGGSKTPGTDGLTIEDISILKPEEVIQKIRNIVFNENGYKPRPVRRKEIPKPNGKIRPLGIPAIWDRLIQQCILQILEPICEAKFSHNSFGFRPERSCENAIKRSVQLMQASQNYYVVELDIQGFFDNVNHSKLIKQIWSLGIHDKKLIWIIKQILKAEIKLPNGKLIVPDKGTPQGGILSPLLANINLNEFDKWVESKFEYHPKATELETVSIRQNGKKCLNKSHGYRRMRETLKKKEVWIVRYADDIRLFCKTKEEALSIKEASRIWLNKRLKLELSEDKTRIVNVRKHRMEFLGFELKLKKNTKSKKWTIESHISKKSLIRIENKLKNQLEKVVHANGKIDEIKQLTVYNSMVLGIQNYYKISTRVSIDLNHVQQVLYRNMYNKFKNKNSSGTRFVKKGRELSLAEKKIYGRYKSNRYIKGCGNDEPIYQIGCVRYQAPSGCRNIIEDNIYTEIGRNQIHKNIDGSIELLIPLMKSRKYVQNENIEYYDNKISLYSAQNGKCAISEKVFQEVNEIHTHHKIPKSQGGKDNYQNLILIRDDYHKLIHASKLETIVDYIRKLQIDANQLRKINNLRNKIGLKEIKTTHKQLEKISKIDEYQILG